MNLPAGLDTSCDAVASFYLHDREHAQQKLIDAPDASFFQKRQGIIEHLKDVTARDPAGLRSLNMWLWGHATVTEVWTDGVLATLRTELERCIGGGGQYSLQILPARLSSRPVTMWLWVGLRTESTGGFSTRLRGFTCSATCGIARASPCSGSSSRRSSTSRAALSF